MLEKSETQTFWDTQKGKITTTLYSVEHEYESPDDIPCKISKNQLRYFILSILKEKGLLEDGE